MSDRVFLDTNFVIYLYSNTETAKCELAYSIVNSNICITSTQVFNEASNVWSKKFKWPTEQIKTYLDGIKSVCNSVVLIRLQTINQALNLKERYGYSFYDSLMLASAIEANCKTMFSEDMQDGQLINGSLRIVNPFAKP